LQCQSEHYNSKPGAPSQPEHEAPSRAGVTARRGAGAARVGPTRTRTRSGHLESGRRPAGGLGDSARVTVRSESAQRARLWRGAVTEAPGCPNPGGPGARARGRGGELPVQEPQAASESGRPGPRPGRTPKRQRRGTRGSGGRGGLRRRQKRRSSAARLRGMRTQPAKSAL